MIVQYWVAMDQKFMAVSAKDITAAFDILFKSLWVFNTVYDTALKRFFEFVESYYYKKNEGEQFGARPREIRKLLDEKRKAIEAKKREEALQMDVVHPEEFDNVIESQDVLSDVELMDSENFDEKLLSS